MYDLDLFFSSPEKKSKKTQFQCYGIDLGTTNSTAAEIVWRPGKNRRNTSVCSEKRKIKCGKAE